MGSKLCNTHRRPAYGYHCTRTFGHSGPCKLKESLKVQGEFLTPRQCRQILKLVEHMTTTKEGMAVIEKLKRGAGQDV